VERSPDEAAKWMVKALMSDPDESILKDNKKNIPDSRIIDDSL
jgi:hypothetical protein